MKTKGYYEAPMALGMSFQLGLQYCDAVHPHWTFPLLLAQNISEYLLLGMQMKKKERIRVTLMTMLTPEKKKDSFVQVANFAIYVEMKSMPRTNFHFVPYLYYRILSNGLLHQIS